MPLRVRCPTGHKLIVPDDRAGRSLRCPRCGQVTVVPGEAEARDQEPVAMSHDSAAAEGSRRRDSSSVLEWPNSIAPPTTVAAPEDQLAITASAPPVATEPPPARQPPARPVVKPKSRALLPREQPPQPPPIVPPLPQKNVSAAEAIGTTQQEANPASQPTPPPAPEVVFIPPAPSPALEAPADPLIEFIEPVTQAQPQPPPPAPSPEPEASREALPEPEGPPLQEVVRPPVHALAPDREHRLAVYQLVAALVAAALFSVAPAVWDIVEYVQIPESQFVARWAFALLLLGLVQLAYAVYLVQLPDWSSVWVVTIYSLALAAIYAAVLGLVLISRDSGLVVNALQLADKLEGGKAILWCLCMVSLSTILAFFAGRLSSRWHKTEMFLRSTGLKASGGLF